MRVPASFSERAAGVVLVFTALAYLTYFVPRGWVPHDEGMIGQSAEQVMNGAVPHVDYQEAYTGGLSWLYAALFRVMGVDLVYVRWLLFAAVSGAAFLMYAIFRDYLRPAGAALAVGVALVWSFANYFAGLPSWWLLICALGCLWAFMRHVQTGRWLYLAVAAVTAGIALAIKQTGLYLIVALVLATLYNGAATQGIAGPRIERLARWAAAGGSIALAIFVLGERIFRAEGIYLFFPIVACALVLLFPLGRQPESSSRTSALTTTVATGLLAAVPIAILLIPYVHADRVWDFVNGAFLLPRKRLVFASAMMPSAVATVTTGIPLLILLFLTSRSAASPFAKAVTWAMAILMPLIALRRELAYQMIWQAGRVFVPFVAIWICGRLISGRVESAAQARLMFFAAAALTWISLNQYPYAAPIYFCYTTPLAVAAGVLAADNMSTLRRHTMVAWAVMLLVFGVMSMNRQFIHTLGLRDDARRLETSLNLPRAHLKIGAADADVYQRLTAAVARHLGAGELIAGPDCPEVYFLAGLVNPAGTVFDSLTDDPSSRGEREDLWSRGTVVVLNHQPEFSAAPSEALSTKLRREFPNGEQIGRFEVRWRE